MLFSCPKASLAPLSAVILHNETLYQKTDEEVHYKLLMHHTPCTILCTPCTMHQVPILDVVKELGIVPGVTLDKVTHCFIVLFYFCLFLIGKS